MDNKKNQQLTEEQKIAIEDLLRLDAEVEGDLDKDELDLRQELDQDKNFGVAIILAEERGDHEGAQRIRERMETRITEKRAEATPVRVGQQFGEQGGDREGFMQERRITPEMVTLYQEQLDQEAQRKGAQELQDNQTPPAQEKEVANTEQSKGSKDDQDSRAVQANNALANPRFNEAAYDPEAMRRQRQTELDAMMAERLVDQENNPDRYETLADNFEDQSQGREEPDLEPDL